MPQALGVSQGNGTGWSQAQLAHLDTDHCVSCKPLSLHLPKVSALPKTQREGGRSLPCLQRMLSTDAGQTGGVVTGWCVLPWCLRSGFIWDQDVQTELEGKGCPNSPPFSALAAGASFPWGGTEVLVPDVEANFRSSARAPLLTHATFSTWRESWPGKMFQAWTVAE